MLTIAISFIKLKKLSFEILHVAYITGHFENKLNSIPIASLGIEVFVFINHQVLFTKSFLNTRFLLFGITVTVEPFIPENGGIY